MKRKRPVELVNFRSGEVVSADSVSGFCRLVGLNGSDKYHMNPVLEGKRLHHRGWCLPSTLECKEIFLDLHRNEYDLNGLLEIADEYKLSLYFLKKLINGERDHYKGIHIKGRERKFKIHTHYKYKMSNGKKTVTTKNLSALTRRLGLPHSSNFSKMVNGATSQAYGYKVLKVIPLPPKKKIL